MHRIEIYSTVVYINEVMFCWRVGRSLIPRTLVRGKNYERGKQDDFDMSERPYTTKGKMTKRRDKRQEGQRSKGGRGEARRGIGSISNGSQKPQSTAA